METTQEYQHTQKGSLILWVLAGTALLFAVIALMVGQSEPIAATITVGMLFVLAACAFLFCSLSVEVTKERIRLWFGPGLIRKKFAITDLADVNIVRNRWYYGWGIRLTPHGWLFNVSGLDAVQIELKSGRKFRIGTDEPEELCAAIEKVI